MLNPGMTVRLKADPSKIGIVTNTPPRELHGCMRYEVSWQNGDRRFHMESTLSVIEEKQETVEDIIEKILRAYVWVVRPPILVNESLLTNTERAPGNRVAKYRARPQAARRYAA